MLILRILAPALLAAAGTFFGANMVDIPASAAAKPKASVDPTPGPTMPLQPTVAILSDDEGNRVTIKVRVSVELRHGASEEVFEMFAPRLRDAILMRLKELPGDDARNPRVHSAMRGELLERFHAAGATQITRVLFTELVVH